MNNDNMLDILSGIDAIEKRSTATSAKSTKNAPVNGNDAMLNILEELDAAQKSVNQLSGTQKLGKLGKDGKHPASDYLVGGEYEDDGEDDLEEQLSPKQSFGDIFKSMEESDDEYSFDLAKELHTEKKKKSSPNKNDNGKFELSEEGMDRYAAIHELQSTIKQLAKDTSTINYINSEFHLNNGDTYIALAKQIVQFVQTIRNAKKG